MAAKQLPPGPQGNFLAGSLRDLHNERLEFLLNCARIYGDIVHLRFGRRHNFLLNHPDFIHEVLVRQSDKFEKNPRFKSATQRTIGQGLIASEGEFHKRQRKLMQPAFHRTRIEAYASIMVDYTQRHMSAWQQGTDYDMHREMMTLTMQIVAKTLFNADVSSDTDDIGAAIATGIKATGERLTRPLHLPDWLPTAENRRRRASAAVMESTIMGIINQRRDSGNLDQGDLLSMLLLAVDEDDGGQMTNQQVRDEAMTLFIAGHETTANALSWTLYLLAQHPDIEARLVAELNSVLAGRAPTMRDLANLPYTDQIVKEAMRLYPPVWTMGRASVQETTFGGYTFPKDSIFLMSPYVMHHDPRYYEEPDWFMPERFAPGYEDRLPRYAYFPFGGGPRVCIGNQFALMEINLVLATLMQHDHLTLVPGQTVVPDPLVTLRPKDGITMRVTPRTGTQPEPQVYREFTSA